MNILIINMGSSSLKCSITQDKRIIWSENRAIQGDYSQEIAKLTDIIPTTWQINAIGHRVVHGGEVFIQPTKINAEMLKKLHELAPLAPLHNPPAIAAIEFCLKNWANIRQFAIFDTAFHGKIPRKAYEYAILPEWRDLGVRKYGFHGSSHAYMNMVIQEFTQKNQKIINCHLGNGCSIAAIQDGNSIDTSMGFTPLDGLVMGTRSGTIDAGIIPYIMQKTKLELPEILNILNKKSGLAALTGGISDMRTIIENAQNGNEFCQIAIDSFIYRICHYIGAYFIALNGADIVSFTGGIGENSAFIRAAICDKLTAIGARINDKKNQEFRAKDTKIACISENNSALKIIVAPACEELMMANIIEKILT